MMFSPLTLPLSLKGRGKSIIVRSTVKDSSQFTIHTSLILMQTLSLPPPSIRSPHRGQSDGGREVLENSYDLYKSRLVKDV